MKYTLDDLNNAANSDNDDYQPQKFQQNTAAGMGLWGATAQAAVNPNKNK